MRHGKVPQGRLKSYRYVFVISGNRVGGQPLGGGQTDSARETPSFIPQPVTPSVTQKHYCAFLHPNLPGGTCNAGKRSCRSSKGRFEGREITLHRSRRIRSRGNRARKGREARRPLATTGDRYRTQ